MSDGRNARVGGNIREAISELLAEVKDPRVTEPSIVSVTAVEVNRDVSVAYVYIAVWGTKRQKARAIEGLRSAGGFLRGQVGRKCNLRVAPELRFLLDEGSEMRDKISEVIADDDSRSGESES